MPNYPKLNDRFITINEAADQIGSTRRFVESRIEIGEIKVFRPSNRFIRIKQSEFNRWIETQSFTVQTP